MAFDAANGAGPDRPAVLAQETDEKARLALGILAHPACRHFEEVAILRRDLRRQRLAHAQDARQRFDQRRRAYAEDDAFAIQQHVDLPVRPRVYRPGMRIFHDPSLDRPQGRVTRQR